jgi:hypothetical protein
MKFLGTHLLLLFSIVSTVQSGISGDGEERGRAYFERRGEVIWEVPTDKKVIALTFDDGPNPLYTPQILSLLKEHHAKATFFVVGAYVQKYSEIAQQLVLMGHEIAEGNPPGTGTKGISVNNGHRAD